VVEDDATTLALVRATLRTADCDVVEVQDGEQAVRVLEGDSFDLVLLDIMLPGLSGYDVLEWMKARSMDVPVVVVTAMDAERGLIREARGGAIDHLSKPFGYEELMAVVERAFALSPEELRAQRARLIAAADGFEAELPPEEPQPESKRGGFFRRRP
jgi:DNA-binding response OmpR family regulator